MSEIGYLIDLFSAFVPEIEFEIDLLKYIIVPECNGDDLEKYYNQTSVWFRSRGS
ncbi:MAG: hypothetical protein JW891_00095 [Candidatus Lokiarchaeota archaeon]|nr:hypothetical protein [Candidatus Lokiarchaeota archaeon]